jgi:predicted deacylase
MPLPVGVTWFGPTLPVHVFQGGEAGPVAIVQAGIHGDEIAGVHALSEWLEEGIAVRRGRLLVIPVMNPPAYRSRTRMAPGGLDLNRQFPGDADAPEREKRLARRFMDLVLDERPALVATLHESLKRFHPEVPASFGQTIVYGVQPVPDLVTRVVARMNGLTKHPYELWAAHHYPVATSSTEVIVEATGCTGVCVETWSGFDERRRIDMQRDVVRVLLEEIGVA